MNLLTRSQDRTEEEKRATPPFKVSYLWLYVKDPPKSIEFYRDVLGLSVVQTFPDGALFNGGGVLIGIHREEGNRKSSPGGAVINLTTKDIEHSYQELRDKGVKFLTGIVNDTFGKVASFKDPDGYELELWQPR